MSSVIIECGTVKEGGVVFPAVFKLLEKIPHKAVYYYDESKTRCVAEVQFLRPLTPGEEAEITRYAVPARPRGYDYSPKIDVKVEAK